MTGSGFDGEPQGDAESQESSLPAWERIAGAGNWKSILIGNGASRAVWDEFRYDSLFDAASLDALPNHLSDEAKNLFNRLGNKNFERVLSQLLVAAEVADALNVDSTPFTSEYNAVKDALVAAVHHVHIPWDNLPDHVLLHIAESLSGYATVYSTNYDIVVYWASMFWNDHHNVEQFKDYFFKSGDEETVAFSVTNAEIWGGATGVLYLHGALHLVRTADGSTHKMRYREGERILDRFGEPVLGGAVPLVVTEGDSESKLASIQQSDYLSFGLSTFARDERDLVIVGHSLSDSDQHLARAIKPGRPYKRRKVAVGIHPAGGDVLAQQAWFRGLIPEATVLFFDATTHPLALPSLHQEPVAIVELDPDDLPF